MKQITIVGAGLVGSLWAVFLSKKGYRVKIFERRDDIRSAEISAGKSINLALSDRGWKALDLVGAGDKVREMAIPMYGRMMHDLDGKLTFQPYGLEDQAIYSVSRAGLNAEMLQIAEDAGDVEIYFNHKCVDVDTEKGICTFENTVTGKTAVVESDLVFGADGAFSAVRYVMQKLPRFDYDQTYLKHGYRELLLPADANGDFKLDKNALHIWPRGQFMLIALANLDGSFTCTLFMPYEGKDSFSQLQTDEQVKSFFERTFPDFANLMPDLVNNYRSHPLSDLATIRCYPWTHAKTALIGDAAHAIVPFYGQGMNAGFEDCTYMWELMEKHGEDWDTIFSEYQKIRKPSGDAIRDLALRNYIEMRDLVADESFLLRKKIEKKIHEKYPDDWMPLYSQVTFSHIPYEEALAMGEEQKKIMDEVMNMDGIEEKWDSDEVEQYILSKKRLLEKA